jgi:sec-independent protein translocase protein TatA
MDLGWPEILLILVIVLVVFGVGRLPQTLRDIGKGVREFRKAQQGDDEEKKEVKVIPATMSKGTSSNDTKIIDAKTNKNTDKQEG